MKIVRVSYVVTMPEILLTVPMNYQESTKVENKTCLLDVTIEKSIIDNLQIYEYCYTIRHI